jgi:hypothetical protein
MKKNILSAIAVMAFGFANAQEGHFKVGAHVGLPTGGYNDFTALNVGVDAAYLWDVADKFSVGVANGYTKYIEKNNGGNFAFISIAGTAQYSLADHIFAGADLGYAGSVESGRGTVDGGLLYQPKLGYQNEKIELYVGYKGILSDETVASVNLGFNYKF